MRVFTCESCGQLIFFDNSRCLRCETPLGYVHGQRDVVALTELADGRLVDLATPSGTWQRCATANLTGCNWVVPAGSSSGGHTVRHLPVQPTLPPLSAV